MLFMTENGQEQTDTHFVKTQFFNNFIYITSIS